MLGFLRREALYLAGGFIVTFVIYLFMTFDPEEVVQGLIVGLVGGVGVAVAIFLLDHFLPGRRRRPSPDS